MTITDAIGQKTNLEYGIVLEPLLITKVTDPFLRFATFEYTTDWKLSKIVDPMLMVSEFIYETGTDRVEKLRTPYGLTVFAYEPPPDPVPNPGDPKEDQVTWISATDPLGKIERLEYRHQAPGLVCSPTPPGYCGDPIGVPDMGPTIQPSTNDLLQMRNSFYWSKKAWAEHPGDHNKAVIYHWLHTTESPQRTSRVLESFKRPLESRIWFRYDGQTAWLPSVYQGSSALPIRVGRLLDDGTTQLTQYEYNDMGKMTMRIDPMGRQTTYNYSPDLIDLLEVSQQIVSPPSVPQKLAHFTYDASSKRQPRTHTDAAGKTTTFTYKSNGNLESITNAKSEVTTFNYDSADAYLQSIVRPLGATTAFEYDSAKRVSKVTTPAPDNDAYEFTYDGLDRVVMVTYPDATFTETTYLKLDVARVKDRRLKETVYVHDELRRLRSVTDPLARTVQFDWCDCGAMTSMTDDLGHTTTWDRDIQGRVTKKTFHDTKFIDYSDIEMRTSRQKSIVDAKGQRTTFTYAKDDALLSQTYSGGTVPTPNLAFTNDPNYPRLTHMMDGLGTTVYTYHPVGALGALQVAKLDGPFTADDIDFTYDELGRMKSRLINGVGISNLGFDALGRLNSQMDDLGSFTYGNVGLTSRLATLTYPTGQQTSFTYHPVTQSRRLSLLTNLGSLPSLLSEFSYPQYNAEGDILQWSQQQGVAPDVITYDDARQLRTFGLTSGSGQFQYGYDDGGNRETEETSSGVRTFLYDTTNTMTGWVDPFETRVLTRDNNGNTTAEGTVRSYEWDAEDRLTKITQGTRTSNFSYDGLGRRVRIIEGDSSGATPGLPTNRIYIWCGDRPCEERDATTNAVTRRFLDHGFEVGATKYFYTRDHLGSVREVVNATGGTAVTRYSYDPWGRQTKLFGTVESPFGYAGYWTQANGGLNLTWFRAYSPELGRWLSRDPIGEFANGFGGATDGNFYSYVVNSPMVYTDPDGRAVPLVIMGALELMGAGALGGSLGAGIGQLVSNFMNSKPRWNDVGKAAGVGAGLGAVAALVPLSTGTAAAVVGGLTAGVTTKLMNPQCSDFALGASVVGGAWAGGAAWGIVGGGTMGTAATLFGSAGTGAISEAVVLFWEELSPPRQPRPPAAPR